MARTALPSPAQYFFPHVQGSMEILILGLVAGLAINPHRQIPFAR